MFNSSYEQYMRTVLGYSPSSMQDTFANNDYYLIQTNDSCMNECNLDDLFPDTYKKVYPLVCNECNVNTMPMTHEILEQMTDNVLRKIEIDLKINTNVKIETRKDDVKNPNVRQQDINVRSEDRVARNDYLRDLIRILILRELIDRGRFPQRPPFPRRITSAISRKTTSNNAT